MICGPVQVCWSKFARYFDVELRQVPCEGRRLLMSPKEITERCDENTIGVVPTLGVTYTLQYEPVQEVATALDDLEEEYGLNIPMHVMRRAVGSSRRLSIPPWFGIFKSRA